MSDSEETPFLEEIAQHRFTEEGAAQVIAIVSAFCHEMDIFQIAQIENVEVDEIRIFMLLLCSQAGILEGLTDDEL